VPAEAPAARDPRPPVQRPGQRRPGHAPAARLPGQLA